MMAANAANDGSGRCQPKFTRLATVEKTVALLKIPDAERLRVGELCSGISVFSTIQPEHVLSRNS
jgi:hypothetical protein